MPAFRLRAINKCLKAIGEAPVNSTQSGVPDAETASTVIDDVTEEVLSAGFTCNMAEAIVLTPDIDGEIKIPGEYLAVDTAGPDRFMQVTIRTDQDGLDKLFNIGDQTYKFDRPITADVTYLFDIDGLPRPLQNYIAARAARIFQESVMGSVSLDSFTSRAEAEAWAKLQDYEADQDDANALTGSFYMRQVTGRNNPLSGR